VDERLHEYVAETKKVHNNIHKKLKNHKLEIESDLANIRSELSNVRQGVVEENLNAV